MNFSITIDSEGRIASITPILMRSTPPYPGFKGPWQRVPPDDYDSYLLQHIEEVVREVEHLPTFRDADALQRLREKARRTGDPGDDFYVGRKPRWTGDPGDDFHA